MLILELLNQTKSNSPVALHSGVKTENVGPAAESSIDLGTSLWTLGVFAVSIHAPLTQPKMRLEQCSLRQRMLLENNLQLSQCQTFELETTPRLAGQLRCVQAKVAP